jgi:hypothetical protein
LASCDFLGVLYLPKAGCGQILRFSSLRLIRHDNITFSTSATALGRSRWGFGGPAMSLQEDQWSLGLLRDFAGECPRYHAVTGPSLLYGKATGYRYQGQTGEKRAG